MCLLPSRPVPVIVWGIGSQCSNRAVGGQTPTLPLNPVKRPVVNRWSLRSGFPNMNKDMLKSISGSFLMVVLSLVVVGFVIPYLPTPVRKFLPF